MKIHFLKVGLLFSVFSILTACKKNNANEIVFDYDRLRLFNPNENRITYADFAYNGKYVGIVDSTGNFGVTLLGKMAEISDKPFSRVTVKGVMRTKNMLAKGGFVVDIQDENGKSVFYNLIDVTQIVKTPNEWYAFKTDLELNQDIVKPKNYFKAYGWSMNNETIYFDDVSVAFN